MNRSAIEFSASTFLTKMAIWLILIAVLVICLAVNYYKWSTDALTEIYNKIPGPKGYPFFGNLPNIPRDPRKRLQCFQHDMVKKYGTTYRWWLWQRPMVFTASPTVLEQLLGNNGFHVKGKSYDALRPFIGESLAFLTGFTWKRNRRMLTPAFHFRILDEHFNGFGDNAQNIANSLTRDIKALCESGTGKREINIIPYIYRCTSDIICESVMGKKMVSKSDEIEQAVYIATLGRVFLTAVTREFASPWQFFPDWMYRYLSSEGRQWYKDIEYVRQVGRKAVTESEKEMEGKEFGNTNDSKTAKWTLLNFLLSEQKKGADLNETQIQHFLNNFLITGHDTISALISWFTYVMSTHINYQELVREELTSIFGDSDRPCNSKDLTEMKFLECCIKETLRMYPPIPLLERMVTKDTVMDGFMIPANTTISILVHGVHYNEKAFPDPFTFKPERFQRDTSYDESMTKYPYAFIPFGAGPRNCIGQKFALLEAKTVLSTLFRRFSFTYDMNKHGPITPGFEVIKEGIPVVITPLTKS